MKVLIAEDDKALALFLRRGLEADGHRVHVVVDGAKAIEAYKAESPDLTILDLNMPVKSGEDVLMEAREVNPELPVLILTGRQELETRIWCLENGADDLMLKPFSLTELKARCRSLLRRRSDAKLRLRAGDVEVDRLTHTVWRAGICINLTNKEFALLEQLMLNCGHCVSRAELLDSIWNLEPSQTTNIVDVYINYLRRKLGDAVSGPLIKTVRGIGYMIESRITLPVGVAAAKDSTGVSTPMGSPQVVC